MALTLLSDAPFASTFAGVNSLQCMGVTSYTPASNPNGIAGSMEIVDGWFKGTIRQTDPPTATGIRSEITLPAQALGDETWLTWDMQIIASEWPDNSGQIVLAQMHPEDAIVAAVGFSFQAINGELFFTVPLSEPPTQSGGETRILVEPLRLGHIYQMAIHTKWINNNTGFMEAFVDGVQIYKSPPRGTAYNLDTPYFKLGIYDGPHLANFGTKSARFRNLKRYSGNGGYADILGKPPAPQKRKIGVF